jgi:hypothetical protein
MQIHLGVSADGRKLAIGTPLSANSDGAESVGAVRVYEYVSLTWTLMGLTVYGDNAGDLLGSAVAVSGDGSIIAIGAPGADDGAGRVVVKEWNEGR